MNRDTSTGSGFRPPRPWEKRLPRVLAIGVVLLAAALRLCNLRDSPGWHHDETIYVGEAWNLIHGEFQWDSVEHTFLPRLPFFHLLIGPLLLAFGKDVVWVRLVTALCGVAAAWLTYRIAREFGGPRPALLGAALYAICPFAVLLNRWGFSYNLDAALGAAGLFFALRLARRPDRLWPLFAAALATGLGLTTDPVMAGRVVFFALVALSTARRPRAAAAIALSLLPLAAYLAVMLGWHRRIFLEDLQVIFGERVGGSADWFSLITSFGGFLAQTGGYGLAGLIGLAYLKRAQARRILLLAFILDSLALMKLSVDNPGLFYRMGIILAPPLFVGLGFLLDEVWRRLERAIRGEFAACESWLSRRLSRFLNESERRMAGLLGGALLVGGLACLGALLAYDSFRGATGRFLNIPVEFTKGSLFEIEDAGAVAQWINERAHPNDLAIATHVEWMLHCRTVSPMLVQLAEGGEGSGTYFTGLAKRFVYPCHLRDARFAVFHEATPKLTGVYKLQPTMSRILETWTRAYSSGPVSVYVNPAWKGG